MCFVQPLPYCWTCEFKYIQVSDGSTDEDLPIFGSQLTQQQELNEMLASIEEIQLLQNIVRAVEAKKTLDIGSYCYVNITCILL